MAVARTPRSRWIDEGFRALADGGPAAVRIESLAKAIGVTKGGFYWYFANRQALLDEMLDAWERDVIDDVITSVDTRPGDARHKLRRLFAVAQTYSEPEQMARELAIRDWARHDQGVATRLRRVDNRRMAFMRPLFAQFCHGEDDVEARCTLTLSLFIASNLIAADHVSTTRSNVVKQALAFLLS